MNALLLASALMIAAADPAHEHGHAPKLGQLSFESTCSPQAHALLERGLGWLHSFEYAPAEASFSEAAAADPKCGIAQWGVAMSYYHPLWAAPTADEFAKGRAALGKARAAGGKSKREQDYIAAIGSFYDAGPDHKVRVLAYTAAMKQLHDRYPADREAAVFYALSLVAAGTLDDDPQFAREKEAAAILNSVLKAVPNHPGVAHYLIHSFDYPPLASLALPAARRYASIAPDSAHAQHMPSHIFTRLGLWEDSIKSNRAAEAAAIASAKARGVPGAWDQQLHAMDYLAYAYLQTGRDSEAQRVFEELKRIERVDPPSVTAAFAATAIPARVLLERRHWQEAAALAPPANLTRLESVTKYKWSAANFHFARAVGAARSGNAALARDEVAKLAAIEAALTVPPGEYDWKTQVAIQRRIAEAWLTFAEGRKDEAVKLMRAVAELDDATEKHPVTPGAVLPAREQLGEILLETGRPKEALAEFESSLKRSPQRLAGLYGAARSAKLAGDPAKAREYYSALAAVTKEGESGRAEIKEARSAAAELARK
jgi:tetratricopeptide (TPR) repeat protein